MTQIARQSYKIPYKSAKVVMMDAIRVAKRIRADEVNPIISENSRPTRKNALEVLDMALRAGKAARYNFHSQDMTFAGNKPFYSVSCNVKQGEVTYFLWLEVPVEQGELLVKKHGLDKLGG